MIRLICVLLGLCSVSTASLAYNQQALMDAFFSVVMVRGHDQSGGMAYGSGVVVGQDQVITNCHVLRQTKEPWVAKGQDIYPIVSVKVDAWHDLCLVNTEPLPFKPVSLGKTNDLQRGQEVVGIGHSNGAPAPLTASGIIEALHQHDNNDGQVIRTTAKFLIGASGSGLFDLEGNLIGINTFKTAGKGGSIHFAVPVEWIIALDRQTAIKQFPVAGQALWEAPENHKPFYMQAAVAESRKNWQALINIGQQWTANEANNPEAWYTLGLANEHAKKADLAMQAYQQVSRLAPNHYEVLVRQGLIAKQQGDYAAIQQITVALASIDPILAKQFTLLMDTPSAH